MRRMTLFCLLPALAAAPAAGQAFEGTVTMTVGSASTPMAMTMMIKGDKVATQMNAGGMQIKSITDQTTGKVVVLFPSMKMKQVMDLNAVAANAGKNNIEIKPLGTSQTVAGYKCDDYEVSQNGKPTSRTCVSTQLGNFYLPQMGGGRGRGGSPDWASIFAGKHAFFPLKVTGADGKTVLEVTSLQKGGVSDDAFTIPDGYTTMPDMGGMGGMMGRGGGGGGF